MAPKRKMDQAGDEKLLFSMFQDATSNLSHFYTQSLDQQKLAFEAGETYAVLKLNEWMLDRIHDGRTLTVTDIFEYLQNKLNNWIPGLDIPDAGGSSSEPSTEPQLGPSTSPAPNPQKEEGSSDMHIDDASGGTNE